MSFTIVRRVGIAFLVLAWAALVVPGAAWAAIGPADFHSLPGNPPCRVIDTKETQSPTVDSGTPLTVTVAGTGPGECGVPDEAVAVVLNVTVVDPTAPGNLTLYPPGLNPDFWGNDPNDPETEQPNPRIASISFDGGRNRAMLLLVELGEEGDLEAKVSAGAVRLIIDVMGYFPAAKGVPDTQTVDEDAAATPIDVLANDLNPFSEVLSIKQVDADTPAHGTVILTGGTPGAHTGLTYQPDLHYCNNPPGTPLATFTYTLNPSGSRATVRVTVNCVNDAPVLTAGGGTPTFTEGGPAVTVDNGITVEDVDDTDLESATVTITNPQNGASEVLAADEIDCGGLTVTPGLNNLSITGTQPLAVYQACLQSVTYDNTSINPGTVARVISFVGNDGTASSVPVTTTLAMSPDEGAPVVTTTAGTTAFTEDGGAVVVDSGVTVTDDDSANLASATVTITNPQDGAAEVLGATNCAAFTVTPALNSLSITGSQPWATYETCLRSVTYNNSSQDPGTTARVISFVANDGTVSSASATKTVTVASVLDAPVVTTTAGTTAFSEDGGAVVVDSGVTVTDADSANLASATVTITNPQDSAAEVLAATACPGLTVTPSLNALGITGSQPPSVYQACLQSVTYDNSSQDPGTTARVISFVANDGTTSSVAANKTVTVATVPDAPVVTTSVGATGFTEDGGAVVVDLGVTVTDADSANLASATVTITNPQDGAAEVLGATSCAGLTVTPGLNSLGITGSQPPAVYETCLKSVTYNNSSQSPGTTARVISFVANDGATSSAAATKTVTVASVPDAPVVTTTPGTTAFTEDGGAVVVDSGVTVTDADSANLASATVTIANPQDGVSEVLAATSCAGLTVTPGPNSLSITGSQPPATYQTCLRSVTYNNSSQNPDATPRVISFVANDGALSSAAATKTVTVASVPDAPTVTTTAGTTGFTEDGGAVVVDAGVTVTDGDSANLASATITITNPQNGAAEVLGATNCALLTLTPGLNSLSITGSQPPAVYETCLKSVTYNNSSQNPATTPRVISFVANDGAANSAAATKTVTVAAVNDAPVVTTTVGSTSFTEDAGAVVVDSGLTVNDVDNANLASATVTITNLLDGAAEVLAASCAGLTVTPGAGTLSITGSQPLAVYQTCLQSVTYNNSSQNPSTTSRQVSFVVNDGVLSSSAALKAVTVIAVNDAPTAVPDTLWDTIGNTRLIVAASSPAADPESPFIFVAGNVLANDSDPDGPAVLTATLANANGATVTMNSDGTFTYVPPAGAAGPTHSFTYNAFDGMVNTPGTVTIDLVSRVWYVKNNQPAGGLGRSTDPFDTLAEAEAASGDNDTIFIFRGDGTITNQNTGITLKNGQRLIGEGVALTVPGSVNGGPSTTSLRGAGTHPVIHNNTDDPGEDHGVSIQATAASRTNIEIRGLNISGRDNGIDVTATGANNAGVTITDSAITSDGTTGAEGIDINAGSTGTVTVTVDVNNLSGRGNAFDARTSAAGALRINLSNNPNILSQTASGIVIDGSGGGVTTITGFAGNSVHQDTPGTGISVTNAIFDLTPGGTFQPVNAGNTRVGLMSGNGVGGPGMVLTNVQGDLSFTDLDIFADGGAGLRASSPAAYTGSAGLQLGVINAGVATIEAAGGPAVDVTTAAINLPLSSLRSTNSPTTGVALNSVTGTFTAGTGSSITSITSAAGTAFQVGSSNATVTYEGTITTNQGTGVSLTNNTGSTISFTSTSVLSLNTGASPAFVATGGGTVTATNTTSTLTTTTATALNVANTTIGAGGLRFRSISSNGGGNSGIVLNTTGNLGGLSVLGNGGSCSTAANCTGGAIQNKTVNGITLNNTRSVSLSNLFVDNNDGSGIFGDDVTNFSIVSSSVTNNGDTQNGSEAGLRFNELLGTSSVTNTTVSGSSEDNIRLTPTSGVMTNLTIANSIIGPCAAPVACNGVTLIATGSADVTVTVTGSTFQNNKSSAFLTSGDNTAKQTINISTSTFQDNNVGVDLAHGGSGDFTFNVSDNTAFLRHASDAIRAGTGDSATNAMQVAGTISNNTIGNGSLDSGSRDAQGIDIDMRGDADAIVSITGNTVSNTDIEGIRVQGRLDDQDGPDAEKGRLDLTLRNNVVNTPDDNSAFPFGSLYGILIEARNTYTMCMDIANNDSSSVGSFEHFRVRQRDSSVFLLERLSDGDGTPNEVLNTLATIESHVAGQNVAGSTADATLVTGFTEAANGTCRKP